MYAIPFVLYNTLHNKVVYYNIFNKLFLKTYKNYATIFFSNLSFNLFFQKIPFSPVEYLKECRGRDLNSRTSTGQGPQPCAVDQAWLPLQMKESLKIIKTIFIISGKYQILFKSIPQRLLNSL